MTRWRARLGIAVASGRGVAPQLFDALVNRSISTLVAKRVP